MEDKTTIKLGNKVMVSDPCYKPGTWCQGVLENVLEGNWNVEVRYGHDPFGTSNTLPHALIAHHENFMGIKPNEECDFEVGVDSGMAGIFNYNYYSDVINYDNESHDKWYKEICDYIFRVRSSVHCDDYIISFTAYGDGGYTCYVGRNEEGKIVSIMIDFIGPALEEEN